MTPLLRTERLSAGYDGVAVVRDLSLEVHPGEVVAILGPNGAGKTTTMLTLAGELPHVEGSVEVLGASGKVPLHRRARRGLGFVTEERSVAMGLTTRQNIAIGRCDPARVLALFPELEPLMARLAGLLSGGEQQMLTLGRALARDDLQLLLADELSLGLAPKAVGRLLRAVRDAADAGAGVLLVEQHVHRVLEIADRIYVLAHGCVAYEADGARARREIDDIQRLYLGSPSANASSTTVPGPARAEEIET